MSKAKWYETERGRPFPAVEAYIEGLDDPIRGHVVALRRFLWDLAPDIQEGIAWGVPFFFRKGPVAYISVAKKHITFGLAKGIDVKDRHGLLTGTGKSPIRKASLKPSQPLPTDAIKDWLTQALLLDELDDAAA